VELASRPKNDIFTRPGEYPELRRRLRTVAGGLDIRTVVAYAFDPRTRLLPYYFTSHRMAPAGARALGSALVDSGLTRTRVVLQQWTPNFRPSEAVLDGAPIEMLLVSSMQIHAAKAYRLIAEAHRAGDRRPLIIAGGPKAIYEPNDLFALDGDPRVGADVVVTGEEFVLMQLLEVLLDYRKRCETMREAFELARGEDSLREIPGLVYRQSDDLDAPLCDTGIQRLVRDLDEFPHPILGYKLLEPPHRGRTLKSDPLPASRVRRISTVSSLSLSHGCKFNCDYCPIPAYNQRTYRHKSGERVADEMRRIREELGIRFFFGTDDNFFNNRPAVEQMFKVMSRTKINGRPFGDEVFWGTEATEFDTWKNHDLLPAARKSGLRAIWFGIEDITATLIRKGQSVGKTGELFDLLNRCGISPRPMLMHHDGQPLYSREGMYGIVNQVRYLWKIGAASVQVTVLTPAVGTRSYEPAFEKRMVFSKVGGRRVDQWQYDGNHVVASQSAKPWRMQLNVLIAYLAFYNPWTLFRSLLRGRGRFLERAYCQVTGMYSLFWTVAHSATWAFRLWRGPIERARTPQWTRTHAPTAEPDNGITLPVLAEVGAPA
jgi:radical SAM superfamily enzyme YgiQ (UPF0313 family)